jgi:hypothetical protein
MFEITGDDIALLRDDDLRTLVGRLCEEEVRKLGFATSVVTWGGDQDATDGGLDVRVELPRRTKIAGFIPRAVTGLQVKKSDMSGTRIVNEMRPASKGRVTAKGGRTKAKGQRRDKLRPVIAELAAKGGAYIIVSAKGSTTDSALRSRLTAMRSALGRQEQKLQVGFYDRGQLATWLRGHPGLIPWVRSRIGRTLTGWRSYGAWAFSPQGVGDAYLLDEELRLKSPTRDSAAGCTATEGLQRLRTLLREPRGIVRLVGLSGVGKTRFAQAIFDHRVGKDALAPSLAVYTNLVDGPNPPPMSVAADLILARTRAVLIIDNCGADLHQRLAEICRAPDSLLSLVTIEFDVRDDLPEGTSAFKLEPSSVGLVERLVKHHLPHVSQIDRRTVATIAGGNARVALALAGTIGVSETIAGLNDREVFRRLFFQGRPNDQEFYRAAQACSLLYSFNAEETDVLSELSRLGSVVGLSAQRMYAQVRDLQRGDLVQRRSVWGAVLPHAIANRLAAELLDSIPPIDVADHLITSAPERILRSFSRRLGYLHASLAAQKIVRGWLKDGGLLGSVSTLDGLGQTMLENIAPVAPEDTLSALERAMGKATDEEIRGYGMRYIQLLGLLAYEVGFFDRCVALLVRFAVADGDKKDNSRARHQLEILFQLILSGTLAPVEQRLRVIEGLLASSDAVIRSIGATLLRAALEAWQFDSAGSFEFGARPRDYGYWPKTVGDARHWYTSVLQLAKSNAISDGASAEAVRAALASAFRGLWSRAPAQAELDEACRAIALRQFWPGGWRAVREVLRYDVKGARSKPAERLRQLEKALRPKDLVERVRAIVLPSSTMHALDAIDESDDPIAGEDHAQTLARNLGNSAAVEPKVLEVLLPELVVGDGLRWYFGTGLAEGASDLQSVWDLLTRAFEKAPQNDRRSAVLCGFLHGLHGRDSTHVGAILDHALTDPILGTWFPVLQAAVPIGTTGGARLRCAVKMGRAPAHFYQALAGGRATDSIPGKQLAVLLRGIAGLKDGLDISIEVLYMRFYSDSEQKKKHDPALIALGRSLLLQMRYSKTAKDDYRLGQIGKACLKGKSGAEFVEKLTRKLRTAVAKRETHSGYHDRLLVALIGAQPIAGLNGLLGGTMKTREQGIRILLELQNFRQNPIDGVAPDDVIAWCKRERKTRYTTMARVIGVSTRPTENGPLEWSATARRLMQGAPDRLAVLKYLVEQFGPLWIGADIPSFEAHVKLLEEFKADGDPAVSTYATEEAARLREEIMKLQRREALDARERDERFE